MMRRERLLLMGFFLLVVLLVSPVSAIDFRDDFYGSPSGVWSHYVSGGHDSVTDGILKTGTVAGSLAQRWNWYVYPEPVDAPFEVSMRFYYDSQIDGRSSYQFHFGLMSSDTNMKYSSFSPIKYQVYPGSFGFAEGTWHTVGFRVLENGEVWRIIDGVETLVTSSNTDLDLHPFFGTQLWDYYWLYAYIDYVSIQTYNPTPPEGELCVIRIQDSVNGSALSGSWHLNILDGSTSEMLVDKNVSGSSFSVYLPQTKIFKAHWLHVEKDGYDQVPAQLLFDVPPGGREVIVRLTPTSGMAGANNSVVTFEVTDIADGSPISGALVNVGGVGKYTGVSGTTWFELPENATYQWVVSTFEHWPIGGNFTLGADDLSIDVSLTRKTSELPRPPLPELPNFPVISPSLDPSGFRMQILSVPILGGIAAPVLDSMDSLARGLDDAVSPVLDVVSTPLNGFVDILGVVGSNLTGLVDTYTELAGVLLSCVGRLLSAFPDVVLGLVSYELVLDLVYLILRGGL